MNYKKKQKRKRIEEILLDITTKGKHLRPNNPAPE